MAFAADLKWRFEKKDGYRITAYISDESFLEHMKTQEEMFVDGDILKVTLEVEQRFNKEENVWEDIPTTYNISKVHDHYRVPRNRTLF